MRSWARRMELTCRRMGRASTGFHEASGVFPAAEPVLEPAMAMADTAPAAEAAPAETPPRYDADSLTYEPDQERREKFLSRFSRWGKKGG